ncbi:MAG TPA: M28 family peptidase [Salinivirgaceae bacterium]|nr:M28 family peptidase [Salinivirgaceae bacterium]
MKKICISNRWMGILLPLIFVSYYLSGQSSIQNEIKEHLHYLASPELQGRYPGTHGDSLAADFIAQQFQSLRLKPLFHNYYQPFEFIAGAEIGDDNLCIISGDTLELFKDFVPLFLSSDGRVNATTSILPADSVKSLQHNIKPNQWLALLLNSQEPGQREIFSYASVAESQKAAGIILIAEFDSLRKINPKQRKQLARGNYRASIPVVLIDKSVWDRKRVKSAPFTIEAKTSVKPITVKTQNVVGYLPGQVSPGKYLIVGAHYDHLGFGGINSGSRMPESHEIHPGADDNASGTVTIIQLAKYFSTQKPDLSIVFIAFGVEEQGLVGSRKFLEELPIPTDSILVMLNFDMVGRMEEKTLYLSGVGTANLFPELIQKQKTDITIVTSNAGSGPSDHATFFNAKIPVLYFNTGIHTDYHTPGDSPEKINYEGMKAIVQHASQLVTAIMENHKLITFDPNAEPNQQSNQTNLKITLGIMPDVVGGNNNGLKVLGVNPGGIAAKLELQKGDLITNINGSNVKNIYDYMNALQYLDRGQVIHITIIRNGVEKVLLTQL